MRLRLRSAPSGHHTLHAVVFLLPTVASLFDLCVGQNGYHIFEGYFGYYACLFEPLPPFCIDASNQRLPRYQVNQQ